MCSECSHAAAFLFVKTQKFQLFRKNSHQPLLFAQLAQDTAIRLNLTASLLCSV